MMHALHTEVNLMSINTNLIETRNLLQFPEDHVQHRGKYSKKRVRGR